MKAGSACSNTDGLSRADCFRNFGKDIRPDIRFFILGKSALSATPSTRLTFKFPVRRSAPAMIWIRPVRLFPGKRFSAREGNGCSAPMFRSPGAFGRRGRRGLPAQWKSFRTAFRIPPGSFGRSRPSPPEAGSKSHFAVVEFRISSPRIFCRIPRLERSFPHCAEFHAGHEA